MVYCSTQDIEWGSIGVTKKREHKNQPPLLARTQPNLQKQMKA